jgi:putative endonuclease
MAKHNEMGKWGELLALAYLLEWDYQVLEKNWRFSYAEIDLIVKKKGILVFVEVKTRGSVQFGPPEAFLNVRKRKMMFDAANVYMEQVDHLGEIRFDVISIIDERFGAYRLRHFQDAFFYGLE